MSTKDWRIGYVICEHLNEKPNLGAFHSDFRVCCKKCFEQGFLYAKLEKRKIGHLSVGKILVRKGAQDR